MRLLLDITHPAHLHFFRNLVAKLRGEGHEVYLAGRHKDILLELAAAYGLELDAFGHARPGLVNLGREMLARQARLAGIIRRFRPDAMMAIAGTFVASLGWLLRVPTYVFYDTEHATVSNLLSYPFATCVYVPRCYLGSIRWRHERYDGYHELAYLHPGRFTADPGVLAEAGLAPGERFSIVRFVAWGAGHDLGRRGLSLEQKLDAVRRLGRHGRVVISTEGALPDELEPLRLRLGVERVHHLMARAALIFGESGTMLSEGAVLGVPGVYVSPLTAGTLEEQEREYGILFNFRPAQFAAAVTRAESILVIGSNTTECHPIIARRIKRNVRENGARLIVADPRATELTQAAALHLNHRPGTDVALLNGLMHEIIAGRWHDEEFIRQRCEDFESFKDSLEPYTSETVESITGVSAEKTRRAAEIFGRATTAVAVYGMGITQHTTGVDNVKSIANLLMLTGNMGREGTGFSPLRGQNNVQGACDMGALPNVYPGYQKVGDPTAQAKFSKAWGVELNGNPGLPLTVMVAAADRQELRGMYIMGENPLMSEPDLDHARHALSKLQFLAVQDIFLTETALLADVILPAASFAEKDGTFTNTERRVQLLRKALPPPGNARQDWQVIADIATRLGYSMQYESSAAIMKEIAELTPIYGGMLHSRLGRTGGLQWPCWDDTHAGTPRLHVGRFTRGKGKFHAVPYRPPAEEPSEEYPMVLTTGRVLEHFHTGSMSRRSRVLETLEPESHVDISPDDAAQMGVEEGDLLRVRSRRGEILTKARKDRRVPSGLAFMAFHWREAPANVLTNPAVDSTAKIPEYKVASVKVTRVSDDPVHGGKTTKPEKVQ